MVVAGPSETEEKFSLFGEFLDVILRHSRSASVKIWNLVSEETFFIGWC